MTSRHWDLEIDLKSFQIRRDGQTIRLTRKEGDVLRVLIQHRNQVLTHKDLLQAVWGPNYEIERNFLYNFIAQLRRKLGDEPSAPRLLLTAPNVGYQWVGPEENKFEREPTSAVIPSSLRIPPVPLTSFIGREIQLEALERMVRKKGIRLITVTGSGGIGKTRLVLEFTFQAHAAANFPDGIRFVDLTDVDSADLVLGSIAQEFGIRESADESLLLALKHFLQDKNILVILDNFEHVQSASAHVLDLLRSSRGAKFLITSRERFGYYGEHVLEIPPLTCSPPHDLAGMEALVASEAALLFAERAQMVNPYFELTSENASVVEQICRRLEGIPLAIELAAVRSQQFDLSELLHQLERQLPLLDGGQSNLPARHRTLRAAIDWSYQLLNAPERRVFLALCVFHGSFTIEAAEKVCAAAVKPSDRIGPVLTALVNKSLVTAQRSDDLGGMRYTMRGILREFASELLDPNAAARYGCLHAEYYRQLLASVSSPPFDTEYALLKVEFGNLRAALNWVTANADGDSALQIATGLYELWLRFGSLQEGKQQLFKLLDITQDCATSARARALCCAGVFAEWLGEPHTAQSLYRESLSLYERLENQAGIAYGQFVLASALINQGDFVEGRALSEQALGVASMHQVPSVVVLALNNLGMIEIYRGDAAAAREIYEQLSNLLEVAGRSQDTAWAYTGLSWVELLQGDLAAAQRYADRSIQLQRQSGDMLGLALALTCESWIALWGANVDDAARKLERCLALCRDLGIANLRIWPLVGLGRLALYQGDLARAKRFFDEALELCKILNGPPMTTWVHVGLGKLCRRQNKPDAAFDTFDRALTLSLQRNDRSAALASLEGFAALFAAHSREEIALQLLAAAERWREAYRLPLPALDRDEHDVLARQLRSGTPDGWPALWQAGRSLDWDGIVRLIHRQDNRFTAVAAT